MGRLEFWGGTGNEGPRVAVDPWDVVTLGGQVLPGTCEVKGLAQLAVDNKKAKGVDGSTLTVTGYQPGPFEIVCTVWTPLQWSVLQDVIGKLWTKPGKRRDVVAVDVSHPALKMLSIKSCVIQGITFPEPGGFEESRAVRFKCIEHAETGKKKATKTAKGSAVVVNQKLADTSNAKNAQPAAPHKDKKQIGGPDGPAAPAAGGVE